MQMIMSYAIAVYPGTFSQLWLAFWQGSLKVMNKYFSQRSFKVIYSVKCSQNFGTKSLFIWNKK